MVSQIEILEKEEKEAEEALQQSLNQSQGNPETSEKETAAKEDTPPLTEVLKKDDDKKEKSSKPGKKEEDKEKPESKEKQSDKAGTDDKDTDFDYEKEFETYGYKLNPDKKDDPHYLAGRFFTTAGKLKEVSTAKKQIEDQYKKDLKEREAKIAEMEAKLQGYKVKRGETEAEPGTDSFDDFKDFEVDEGFLKALDKRYSNKKTAEYENKIQELKKDIETFKTDSYEKQFWREVESKTPELKKVSDRVFDVWLDQIHYGNTMRKDIYINALNRGDTETVAKLFKDCYEEMNKPKQKKQDPIPDNIRQQVSANPIANPSTMNTTGKPVITQKQVADFDKMVRRGEISPEEEQRIEAEIELAYLEGRVR